MCWRRIDLRSLNFKISHSFEVANCADIWKPKNRLIILCIGFPLFIFCNVGSIPFNYDLKWTRARKHISWTVFSAKPRYINEGPRVWQNMCLITSFCYRGSVHLLYYIIKVKDIVHYTRGLRYKEVR